MALKGRFLILAAVLLIVSCDNSSINSLQKEESLSSLPVGTMLKAEDGTFLMNRVMSVSDPMRDPNWNWTTDTIDTLYITSYADPKLIRRPYYGSSAIKPFFTDGQGHRDIWPEDGWKLVLRDFGTTAYQVPTPFFILYNKHLGILRYFFFGNLVSEQITHAVGHLSIKGSNSPFFTLADSTGHFIDNYNVYKQHTISEYYQDQWNVMEFRMAGFDPDIHSKYARFIIDVDAYKNFDLNVQGSVNLKGVLGSGGSTHSSFLETILQGVKLYKSISKGYKDIKNAQESFKDLIKFAESDEHKDAWWSDILASAASVGATSWIPALGPIVGVANFILGGGSSQSRQPRPITLTGGLELKGTISSTSDISQLEFIVPGSKVDNPDLMASYNELPLYHEKPGVFNLASIPQVEGKAFGDCINNSSSISKSSPTSPATSSLVINYEEQQNDNPTINRVPPGGNCDTFIGYIQYFVTIDYVTNSLVFNSNKLVEMAFTFGEEKEAISYIDITDGTAVVAVEYNRKDVWATMVTAWTGYFKGLGIMVTLEPKNSPTVAPVQILKEYPVNYGEMENLGITYY